MLGCERSAVVEKGLNCYCWRWPGNATASIAARGLASPSTWIAEIVTRTATHAGQSPECRGCSYLNPITTPRVERTDAPKDIVV